LQKQGTGMLIGLRGVYAACRVLERQLVGGLAPDTPLALQAALAAWVLSHLGSPLLAPWSMWMFRHR
jgi:hypothetical protein